MKFLIFICTVFVAFEASACRVYQPLTQEQMDAAESVFIGRAVAYDANKVEPDRLGKPAHITFYVEEVLSGKSVEGHIEVSWTHGTFGESRSLEEFKKTYGETTKVGLVFAWPWEVPKVVNAPCSGPYMFVVTPYVPSKIKG